MLSPANEAVVNLDAEMPSAPSAHTRRGELSGTPSDGRWPAGTSSGDARIAALTLDEARMWARVGVVAALALVLSYIETFIPLPVPVPGIKLGLANIAVLAALALLDVKSAAFVALIKVLAAGFLFGNPLMMAYSAGGTVLAFASMAALSRIRGLSIVLVAIVGAVLHNVGQLAVASAILGTPLVWATAPLLVIAACFTGALSGIATRYTLDCLGDEA